MEQKLKEKALVEIVNEHGKVLTSELIRPEVARFALEMEQVLKANDYKGGWDDMSHAGLFGRIKDEFEELQKEHIFLMGCPNRPIKHYIKRMHEECIDLANFCMFFCHNYPLGE